ncbi:uncharacterized protein LOC124922381 [Impatiens glandulifera]|uniref:uncharacterized protein LOC124922381 n=1 Tax=Impatiens glandulifera TaxID=253017 RepID=UPI001FB04FEB|nr:uncharacterized protein LOC124922381 [Impatiens glandulifera]
MQQRKPLSGNGRPSGTDGSDFSFRMVVDSRYTKVAKGKSRLSVLLVTQAMIQLLSAMLLVLPIIKNQEIDVPSVSAAIVGFLSLICAELGRRRSKVGLLKFYILASSGVTVFLIASSGGKNLLMEVIQDPTNCIRTKQFELLKAAVLLLGLVVQIIAVSTTSWLIFNMSPPKRASS